MIDVKNIREVQVSDYDEVWACVRSIKDPQKYGMIQVAELSPSVSLFHAYLQAREQGIFDRNWFQQVYVPQFLSEMMKPEAKKKLNELFVADRMGKKICIVCFCNGEELCHRSILAGLLQGCGCNVTGVKREYSSYYLEYRIMQEKVNRK